MLKTPEINIILREEKFRPFLMMADRGWCNVENREDR
jgi:hypothetical protein